MRATVMVMVWVGIGGLTRHLTAQVQHPADETIRVFFDCAQYGACSDHDFFHRQIPYVDWVRDRQDADVHILITQQTTGGGGTQYRLAFLGLDSYAGQDDSLVVNMPATATLDEERRAIAEKVKLGLVRYLAQTDVGDNLRVSYGRPRAGGPGGQGGAGRPGGSGQPARPGAPGGPPGRNGGSPATSAQNDPWNYWVFSLSGNAFLNGQSSSKTANYFGSVDASRVTSKWKLSFSTNYSLEDDKYILTNETVRETQRAWGLNSFVVRSAGPQWAVGLRGDLGHSDFFNQAFKWSLRPGVEYDFFPYSQSSRRSLTLQYLVGPEHWKYRQRTIYERSSETRTQESLTARLSLIQPWGQWSTSLTGAHYVSDMSKYHVSLNGNLRVRIFKGLSLRASAYYSWLHDQIYLSAGGATDEQTLLHLRQLYTTFSYYASFGFQYRFGSIFNNVVNPRFGSSNGGMIIIG